MTEITNIYFPPWALMWLLASGLYAAAKVITIAAAPLPQVSPGRKLAYLLLFPGMNAAAFCATKPRLRTSHSPLPRYLVNALLGILLLWVLARIVPPEHPLLRGWVGMLGLVMLLHFGLLQLVSLAWQSAGRDAPPLMDSPILSRSVTEFWSRRWNTAFRQLSHQFLFKPLVRRTNPPIATLVTFGISGIVHDLLISIPADGGYGLPTVYFLLQGVGVLFERSCFGRRLFRRPIIARCFTILIVVVPTPLLFHPAFVSRVFVPFMMALGALPSQVHA